MAHFLKRGISPPFKVAPLPGVDLLFRLRLTDITKSFVVTFDFVHRRADSLGYPCEQPAPSKIGDILIRYFLEGLLAAHVRCGVDGRAVPSGDQLESLGPAWYGHSVGHWEGDTLVVITVDLMTEH